MTKYVQPNITFDSSVSFLKNVTFDSSVYLQGVTHISNPGVITGTPYALVVNTIGNDISINAFQLGTMAAATAAAYDASIDALRAKDINIDTSLNGIWTKLGSVDTSLNGIWTKLGDVDTSLNNLSSVNAAQDASIVALRTKDTNIDTSLNGIWTKLGSVDTSLLNLGIKDANQDVSLNAIWTKFGSVDTSLLNLGIKDVQQDASIVALRTKDTNIDTSLNALWSYELIQDASILAIGGEWKTYVDGSLATRDSSIVLLFSQQVTQDASIVALRTKDTNIDTSLNGIWTKLGSVDTSLLNLGIVNAAQDASIVALRTKDSNIDISLNLLANWNVSQDASIEDLRDNMEASLGLYVLKAGDTMTGPLSITNGGLSVTNDISVLGNAVIVGDAAIGGSLTINGSLYVVDVETIDVSSSYIHLNTGLTGTPPATLQSGIIIGRGDESPFVFVYDETTKTFRIGISDLSGTQYSDASTQSVATREDNPTDWGIAIWNEALDRFDTSTGFTFIPGSGLKLPIAPSLLTETTALVWDNATGSVGYRDLGTMAFETATNYVTHFYLNASLNTVWTKFSNVDTSLNGIWTKLGSVDTSLLNLGIKDAQQDASIVALRTKDTNIDTSLNGIWTKLGSVDTSLLNLGIKDANQDISINTIWTKLGSVDTSLLNLGVSIQELSTNKLDAVANIGVAGSASIFSYETGTTAYLKKLVAGSGASITEDTSTITISVTGVAGYAQKYTGTFDGSNNSTYTILAATHSMGTGPFNVAVYENDEQIYVSIQCEDNGDITLNWTPSSINDVSCKFVIMG